MPAILAPNGEPMTEDIIDYFGGLLAGDNPNKVRAITVFFDSEPARSYFLPNAKIVKKGFNSEAVNREVKKLIRLDSVAWVTYEDADEMVGAYIKNNGNHWNTT